MYHLVGKEGEGRGVGISRTAGCAASCLPSGLPVLPGQTAGFGAPMAAPLREHRKQEKFLRFPFRFLWVYAEGSFLNISEKNLGVKDRRGEIFKWYLNNQISSPSSDCFTNTACQLQVIECKVQISKILWNEEAGCGPRIGDKRDCTAVFTSETPFQDWEKGKAGIQVLQVRGVHSMVIWQNLPSHRLPVQTRLLTRFSSALKLSI